MDSVFIVVTFLTLVALINCQGNLAHFNIPKGKFGLKLENSVIETKYDIHILASCARECFYVTKCKSFSYNKIGGMCLLNSLNRTAADVADIVEDGKYIYSDLTDWKKEMVYTCGEKPCGLNEKCIPYKPHKCIGYCGIPKSVTNAEVDIGEVHEGSVRNYTCISPNVPTSSDTSVTCQSNSGWTTPNFQCIVHCGPPPNITNADVGPGEETENATRTYTCRGQNTAPTTEMSIICQQNTYWSSPEFNCPAYCGSPNSVANAKVDSGEELEGSVRNYTCIARHVPTSSDTSITCQPNSEWTAPNFQCIAHCGPPPTVTYGDVETGAETENTTRTITCQEPYTASKSQITCQQSTYWSSTAIHCQLITTCQELRNCNPNYGDDEYWLVLDNFDTTRRMKIRCNDMSGTPYETLTLYIEWKTWYRVSGHQFHNGYYNDIAVDVKTLRLSEAKTEDGTNHCMIGYGTITSHPTCNMTNYLMTFYLYNTGFRFNPTPTWSFTAGITQPISVQNLPNKLLQVAGDVSLNNAYVTYAEPFTLQIDQNEVVPEEQATKPQCA